MRTMRIEDLKGRSHESFHIDYFDNVDKEERLEKARLLQSAADAVVDTFIWFGTDEFDRLSYGELHRVLEALATQMKLDAE